MGTAATTFSFEGQVLREGVRQAVACSGGSILCYAKGHDLTFVALSSARLLISWQYHLATAVSESLIFVIPPMLTGHLSAADAMGTEQASLSLRGNEVRLVTHDKAGTYELRWRSELHLFPAPPELSTLLAQPDETIRMNYIEFTDALHQAVAHLGDLESQQRIHRTRLAISLEVHNGQLMVEGQEIQTQTTHRYYFDPRLAVRALEYIHAEQIEVGVTQMDPFRAALTIVDRQPHCTTHCSLLSIGLNTQRLYELA